MRRDCIMKRGTTPILRVSIDMELALMNKVEFLFKNEYSECAPTILTKVYPTDVKYNEDKKLFEIPFNQAETRLFNGRFWMDTRITTVSDTIPQTSICELYMRPTLFKED